MMCSCRQEEYQMIFDLEISSLYNSTHWCSMNIFATVAMVVSYLPWKD